MSQPLDNANHGTAVPPSAPTMDPPPNPPSATTSDPSGTLTAGSSPYPSPSPSGGSGLSDDQSPLPSPSDSATGATAAPGSSSATASQTLDSGMASDPMGGTTDGLTDRLFRSKHKGPVAAIFIHAGAGFHSTSNEHVHLEACSEAAQMAMKFLKAGGTAVDAVEAAIKCLEDREITNAGFGSNLSIDGIVEGDATMVDHLGRSGACGAVPMIKNPISLARLILERSNVPLSLRRIPPNILVGLGARRFAEEHGMRLVANDDLVSRGARERFYRWRQDLMRAELMAVRHSGQVAAGVGGTASAAPPPLAKAERPVVLDETKEHGREILERRSRAAAQLGAVSQPQRSATLRSRLTGYTTVADMFAASTATEETPRTATPHPKRLRVADIVADSKAEEAKRRRRSASSGDGSVCEAGFDSFPSIAKTMLSEDIGAAEEDVYTDIGLNDNDTDIITDTVGAIAIDLRGNIAAGSSSGGIGMKHSGRIGPAALVGIGTAVMPVDPKDKKGTCVAAVTSGTGEHMATTMASHTCAERLYYNLRRAEGGSQDTEYDEDTLMKSFVLDDFMDHPGVKNQISGGAIGVMAAKRTNKAIYFYFAHNTDSFALASMTSNDPDPLVVMSRLGPREHVASGGRKIKSGH